MSLQDRDEIIIQLRAEIERLRVKYACAHAAQVDAHAEINRLKAELRIWQECSARQDHELDDLARKLEQAEVKLERCGCHSHYVDDQTRAELEAKLTEARGEGFSEGAKGAFAWQERAKRAEDKLAEAQAEIERLKAWERAAQEGHPSPCTLGPLCPYCEIERLKGVLDRSEQTLRDVEGYSDAKSAEIERLDRLNKYNVAQAKADRELKIERVKAVLKRGRLAEAKLEEAKEFGAEMMLSQMVKAVESGGRFSDERANDFVDAKRCQNSTLSKK